MSKQLKTILTITISAFFILGISVFSINSLFGQSTPNNQNNNSNSSTQTLNTITTSFYQVEFLAKNIAGNTLNVQNIVQNNISPHDYESTPQDIAKIENSKLFIYMGAGIDGFADKIITKINSQSTPTLALNNGLSLLEGSEHEHEGEGQKAETKSPTKEKSYDPHTWLDPKNMIIATDNITTKLSTLYPNQKATFEANSSALKSKLQKLDSKFTTGLSQCQHDFIVTSHDAFGYLAKGYNFNISAVAGNEPSDQVSLQEFGEVVDRVKTSGIGYVFQGDDENSKTITNLASQTNTQILDLSTMETVSPTQDYFGIMESNLANLQKAMNCK
jgi:zinc transport system substrate-binding protein